MARALTAGPAPRRRAFFGLLDADGWGWASLKAFFWFVVIIFVLGYIPDRAYYFTVSRTVDLGIMAWSPVNFCPTDPNKGMPCPAPIGAVTPWERSPEQVALPAARADAAFVQVGRQVLLIGGTDGQAATDSVLVAPTSGTGNFDRWQEAGATLPDARADAAVAFLNGLIYVSGGVDEAGQPTDTTWVLTPDLQTGDLGEWQTGDDLDQSLDLPEARTGGSLVALADGLLFVGGSGPDGQPTKTVWKSLLGEGGALGEWTPQAELVEPVADGVALLNGEHVWVVGGRDANGPTARTQRATVGTGGGIPEEGDPGGADSEVDEEPGQGGAVGGGDSPDDPPGSPQPGDDQGVTDTGAISRWGVNAAADLPEPRVNAMGFAANGSIYVIGGSDGQSARREVYWAVPTAGGDGDDIPEWKRLGDSDLPEGRERGAVGQSGPNLFVIGGVVDGAAQTGSARTNMSPQEPFFRLGLVGMTVPALKIEGEIGQQLGYLNAAGAGGAMFALLIAIGYLFAHREQTRSAWNRFRTRRARRAQADARSRG